jgi:ATP-dependent protease ClpP protease subunit
MIHWRKKLAGDEQAEDNNNLSFVIQPNSNNSIPSDNKIYLYSEINRDTILMVCKQIDDIGKQLKLLEFTYDLKEIPPIELHINSDGGDLSSALILVDKILKSKLKIHTHVEGIAASAATLISVVGHKRFITPHSYMLLHQLRATGWGGTYENLVDEKQNCDVLMDTIKSVYIGHSKFKQKELNDLLKHDLFINSHSALALGIVDEIV